MKKFAVISAIMTGLIAGGIFLTPAAEAGFWVN